MILNLALLSLSIYIDIGIDIEKCKTQILILILISISIYRDIEILEQKKANIAQLCSTCFDTLICLKEGAFNHKALVSDVQND